MRRMRSRSPLPRDKAEGWKIAVYFILRGLVIAVLVQQLIEGNYNNVFTCLLTLVLSMVPSFIEKRLKIMLPDTLEIIIFCFIFAAEILGEVQAYYVRIPYWDMLLHTLNGFIMAAVGVSMIDILNRNDRFKIKLSPAFMAMVAFCFSMTIGVLWEFFEFGMDVFFLTDMQKDTVIPAISSVLLDPGKANNAVRVTVESLMVNGEEWNLGGYLDIGLFDTMEDLLVNFAGAVLFSAVGFFYIRGRDRAGIVESMVPKLKTAEEIEEEKAEEEDSRQARRARRKLGRR